MSDLRLVPGSLLSSTSHFRGEVGAEPYPALRAAEVGAFASFTAEIPRRVGAREVCLLIRCETQDRTLSLPMKWIGLTEGMDAYSCQLDTAALGVGLCFLSISCETSVGRVYSDRTSGDTFVLRSSPAASASGFQLLLSEFAYPKPECYYGGIIYQIFVDRFSRGRQTPIPEGMRQATDWDTLELEYPAYPGAPMKNNIVYGGNLDGIRRKLDYLASLGVTLIYLTPIFSSPSNHKYDTADYNRIDPLFGDDGDLAALIAEAREHGIGILLDGVFNHTGADSLYFNREGRYPTLGAAQGSDSPYYGWYRFGHEYPVGYECWWNIDILPRIHTEEPSCAEFFVGDGGVISRYAGFGIAGMRLDVADELSDGFISRIKERLSEGGRESLLYGEVWEDASNKIAYDKRKCYYHGKELDGVMNYPLRTAILSYLCDGSTDAFRYYLDEVMPNMPLRILHAQMNLIGTHDTARAITVLAGESADGKTNDELYALRMNRSEYALGASRLRAAWAVLATMPGMPMIYYGDEVGMQGYADPFNRLPYPWGREDRALLSFYREVASFRKKHRVYAEGRFLLHRLDADALIFERYDNSCRSFTVVNRSERTLELEKISDKCEIFSGRIKKGSIFVEPMGVALVAYQIS